MIGHWERTVDRWKYTQVHCWPFFRHVLYRIAADKHENAEGV